MLNKIWEFFYCDWCTNTSPEVDHFMIVTVSYMLLRLFQNRREFHDSLTVQTPCWNHWLSCHFKSKISFQRLVMFIKLQANFIVNHMNWLQQISIDNPSFDMQSILWTIPFVHWILQEETSISSISMENWYMNSPFVNYHQRMHFYSHIMEIFT